ncbi:hypothetical protein, unlikely [Trypanosoma brucei gambiense DAL972]|uniref:Uncharacterized protein n=1 Tax=Trypanosoma brucei gambiense (strain MHOM/CI/86/DAL972) TaxID=679716 RepID=C9ZUD6_TRYB9|nr:hypothetical protein, unlikely [Trypanosoma brucei gambiense DAL972]CBH13023.1 hypothetical protein, unlikely [Trypanosoma brucei gambiense DAL972]|eukprot:XP_011775301.1 hypothetical protein, unlikely [Trypanosoma brucei gambiense DAL972]
MKQVTVTGEVSLLSKSHLAVICWVLPNGLGIELIIVSVRWEDKRGERKGKWGGVRWLKGLGNLQKRDASEIALYCVRTNFAVPLTECAGARVSMWRYKHSLAHRKHRECMVLCAIRHISLC